MGESLSAEFATGTIAREDIFITTKLWNTNHRPERVEPAFDASCQRLGISYVDLYLIHTPFAFQPGDNMDPRDQAGNSTPQNSNAIEREHTEKYRIHEQSGR